MWLPKVVVEGGGEEKERLLRRFVSFFEFPVSFASVHSGLAQNNERKKKKNITVVLLVASVFWPSMWGI